MDRWTEPTLQHSIPRTNRLQRDKQCYLRGFLSKYVLIFSLKYGRNNLFNDLFLSAFILICCHHARGFFFPFFANEQQRRKSLIYKPVLLILQRCFEFILFKYIKLFLFFTVGCFCFF